MLLFLLLATSLASPFYGQELTGSVTGMVLDKDGKTPLVGASIEIVSWVRNSDGSIRVRKRIATTTLTDGRYRSSEVPVGRITIAVIVNNQPFLPNGGNDIAIQEGRETVANLDLSKTIN